jgi:iron(III) transport system substrate-binding protein
MPAIHSRHMAPLKMLFALALVFLTATSSSHAEQSAATPETSGEVNIYSYRQPYLITPLLEAFEKKTGIKSNVIFAKKGLIERIAAEGANSPADLLLTTGVGELTAAAQKGVTQPVVSETINQNIPARYRDPDGNWFALTRRGRVVYVSKARVAQDAITYEELADPKWRGKICIRSGHHVYNVALIAAMVSHLGEAKTEQWLQGLKANLARKPGGNDRAQVKGVFAGECDIAVGNTYYMAQMMLNEKNPEQKEWAESVKMLFPNTASRGTHVNISGMSLAKNAPNKAAALALMEYLASDEAQRIYAEINHEYPVKDGVPWSAMVQSWGNFKADEVALQDVAANRKRASELVDKVALDDGPSS